MVRTAISAVAAVASEGDVSKVKALGGWSEIIKTAVAPLDQSYEGPFGTLGKLSNLLDINQIRNTALIQIRNPTPQQLQAAKEFFYGGDLSGILETFASDPDTAVASVIAEHGEYTGNQDDSLHPEAVRQALANLSESEPKPQS